MGKQYKWYCSYLIKKEELLYVIRKERLRWKYHTFSMLVDNSWAGSQKAG